MLETAFNSLALAGLLTAIFVLRFRVWERPRHAIAYFVFFAALDFTAMWQWVPAGAFGPGLGVVCLALLTGLRNRSR